MLLIVIFVLFGLFLSLFVVWGVDKPERCILSDLFGTFTLVFCLGVLGFLFSLLMPVRYVEQVSTVPYVSVSDLDDGFHTSFCVEVDGSVDLLECFDVRSTNVSYTVSDDRVVDIYHKVRSGAFINKFSFVDFGSQYRYVVHVPDSYFSR